MRDVLLVIVWFIGAVIVLSGASVFVVDAPTWALAVAAGWLGVKVCGFCYWRLGK